MASLYIKKTTVLDGSRRYAVKYRRGGMGWPVEHGGTFKTLRDANIRKTVVGEWLAAGKDPKVEMGRMLAAPVSMRSACADWLASKRSVTDATRANYRSRVAHIEKHLDVAPTRLTVADVNGWIGRLEDDYKPGTVALFVAVLRQVLDHADVIPNVARDRRVELPRRERGEVKPPTANEFLEVLRRTNAKYRPVVVLVEQTGMRVSEAVTLTWDDVDVAGGRLLVSSARSKTGRARWVEVADWMLEALGARGTEGTTHPVNATRTPTGTTAHSHPSPRVFPGMTRQKVYNAIKAGCEAANVETFGPHALRHRRASILHDKMSPARAAEILGHSAQEHLRTYAHVMPVDEVAVHDLISVLMNS